LVNFWELGIEHLCKCTSTFFRFIIFARSQIL
jgi:hypothetical protein